MEGWIFAVALLLAVLAFEVVAFRYFSDVSLDAVFRSSDASATPSAGATAEGASAVTEADEGVCECHNCGARNEDVATVHYCQNCLSRIK